MRKFASILFFMGLFMSRKQAFAIQSEICVTSPDRPPVWYNRSGDKVSEDLVWNRREHELIAYVSYNSVAYLHPEDQLLYDTFHLAFPSIRLDESKAQLYFVDNKNRKTVIGVLHEGPFGLRAQLRQGVTLSVHRQNGFVEAKITSQGHG